MKRDLFFFRPSAGPSVSIDPGCQNPAMMKNAKLLLSTFAAALRRTLLGSLIKKRNDGFIKKRPKQHRPFLAQRYFKTRN